MFLTDYVKKYGHLSFKEKPFNVVDACILSTAVYSNFEVVAPSIYEEKIKPTYIKDISTFDLSVVTAGKILVTNNVKMIPAMKLSKRFGDIQICGIHKVFDKLLSNQFYACTYIIPDVGVFIAYRGTDASVVGWREDLITSVNAVIPSQLDALDYIHLIAERFKGPLYVGGHSKGGNLSMFATIYCNKDVQKRIVNSFNFDGNGSRSKSFYEDPRYLAVKDRIKFVCPYDDFVGEIFHTHKECIVVESKAKGIFQHDTHKWIIDEESGDFKYLPARSKKALIRHWVLNNWINKVPHEDLLLMIDYITVFLGDDNTLFTFLFNTKKIKAYIDTRKKFTKEERTRMKVAAKLLLAELKVAKLKYKLKKREKDVEENF